MKIVYWIIGIVVSVPVFLMIIIYGASEMGGEVVTLERTESNGDISNVRIWIVDQNDSAWIEHGDAASHYIKQLSSSPDIVLTRGGQRIRYTGSADPESHALYHQLRREKYGWADQVIALFGGDQKACTGVPVRLQTTG